jgi:hypothetical protein
MVRKRRSYSWELKIEAVALVTEGGLSISHAARCSPNPSSRPLEKAKEEKTAKGEIETEHVGDLGSQRGCTNKCVTGYLTIFHQGDYDGQEEEQSRYPHRRAVSGMQRPQGDIEQGRPFGPVDQTSY